MKQTKLITIAALAIHANAFTILQPTRNTYTRTILQSTPDSSDEETDSLLINGKDMSKALQGIASESGYLEVARTRNEEAKAQLLEKVRLEEEEAERKRQEREERGAGENNCGPGDMSSFVPFKDDGYDDAEDDGTGLWATDGDIGKEGDEEEEEKEEEPKLFLGFDDDEVSTNPGGLIL